MATKNSAKAVFTLIVAAMLDMIFVQVGYFALILENISNSLADLALTKPFLRSPPSDFSGSPGQTPESHQGQPGHFSMIVMSCCDQILKRPIVNEMIFFSNSNLKEVCRGGGG